MNEVIPYIIDRLKEFWYVLFYWCVDAMKYFSEISGLSYETINLLLFVILGPLSTCLLFTSNVLAYTGDKKASICIDAIGTIIALSVLIVSVYSILNVPV